MSLKDRRRLARELHDGPIQTLTMIALQVGICQRAARRGDTEALNEGLDRLAGTVQRGIGDFRQIVSGLRQPVSNGQRLADTLFRHVDDYRARTDLDVVLDLSDATCLNWLSDRQRMAVLHVVREATQNAYKHANASQICISIQPRSAALEIRVEDDGCGFDANLLPKPDSSHMGLVGMREWAEEAGGTLLVESQPGQGCCVVLAVPFVCQELRRECPDAF